MQELKKLRVKAMEQKALAGRPFLLFEMEIYDALNNCDNLLDEAIKSLEIVGTTESSSSKTPKPTANGDSPTDSSEKPKKPTKTAETASKDSKLDEAIAEEIKRKKVAEEKKAADFLQQAEAENNLKKLAELLEKNQKESYGKDLSQEHQEKTRELEKKILNSDPTFKQKIITHLEQILTQNNLQKNQLSQEITAK